MTKFQITSLQLRCCPLEKLPLLRLSKGGLCYYWLTGSAVSASCKSLSDAQGLNRQWGCEGGPSKWFANLGFVVLLDHVDQIVLVFDSLVALVVEEVFPQPAGCVLPLQCLLENWRAIHPVKNPGACRLCA